MRIAFGMALLTVMLIAYSMSLMIYWTLFDTKVPAILGYQHLVFVSEEIKSRDMLKYYEVTTVKSGQFVYRYLEYCIDRNIQGEIHGSWVNGLTITLPILSTVGVRGCYQRTLRLQAPTVTKPAQFRYVQTTYYQVNPLRTNSLELTPMSLTVVP